VVRRFLERRQPVRWQDEAFQLEARRAHLEAGRVEYGRSNPAVVARNGSEEMGEWPDLDGRVVRLAAPRCHDTAFDLAGGTADRHTKTASQHASSPGHVSQSSTGL